MGGVWYVFDAPKKFYLYPFPHSGMNIRPLFFSSVTVLRPEADVIMFPETDYVTSSFRCSVEQKIIMISLCSELTEVDHYLLFHLNAVLFTKEGIVLSELCVAFPAIRKKFTVLVFRRYFNHLKRCSRVHWSKSTP